MLPKDLKYTAEHEWLKIEGDRAIVGITNYAQKELGDVVFVDLPAVGQRINIKEGMATIESVKAVSEIYAPVNGEIVEINDNLEHSPEFINQDPYGKGWIAIVELTDQQELDQLLNSTTYAELIGESK